MVLGKEEAPALGQPHSTLPLSMEEAAGRCSSSTDQKLFSGWGKGAELGGGEEDWVCMGWGGVGLPMASTIKSYAQFWAGQPKMGMLWSVLDK